MKIERIGRRERKKNEVRTKIVQSAMALFRKQGFESITMESIADTADVSKRTLYSYFPVKAAIIAAYWQHNVKLNKDLFPLLLNRYPDTHSRLTAVFLSAAAGFKSEPEFARIQFSFQFQQIGKDLSNQCYDSRFDEFLIAVIEAGQERRDIRTDIPADELASQAMFNFTAICLMWFCSPDSFLLEERLKRTVDCFIDGAGNR